MTVPPVELDRVGDSLEEMHQTPVWSLIDPENASEIVEVPGLKRMLSLSELERLDFFLLSMGECCDSLIFHRGVTRPNQVSRSVAYP